MIISYLTILLLFIGMSVYFLCKNLRISDLVFYFIFCNLVVNFVNNDMLIMWFTKLLWLVIIIPYLLLLGSIYSKVLTFMQKSLAWFIYIIFLLGEFLFISKFELEYKILFYFLTIILSYRLLLSGISFLLLGIPYIKDVFELFLIRFKIIKQNILIDNLNFYTKMLAITSFVFMYLIIRLNPVNIKFIDSGSKINFSDGLFSTIKNVTPVLSLYGMYFGFLQFIANTAEKDIYMGENKLNYILNRSSAYQLSKSKMFYFFILSFCLIPFLSVFLYRNTLFTHLQKDLNIIWQLDFLFLLLLYLFLVITMIKTVSTTIELRIGKGKWIESKILIDYKIFYENLFWKSYSLDKPSMFFSSLKKDIEKIIEYSEVEQLLNGVFDEVFEAFKYKSYNNRWIDSNIPKLLSYYPKYINEFTTFMKKCNIDKNISSKSWFYIFELHQQMLELIIKYNKSELLKVDEFVYDIESNSFTKMYKLLFDTLILRRDVLSLLISDYSNLESNSNNYFLI